MTGARSSPPILSLSTSSLALIYDIEMSILPSLHQILVVLQPLGQLVQHFQED